MPSTPDPDPIVQVGHLQQAELPTGWRLEPIEWNGQKVQVGFDPRYQVMRVERDPFTEVVEAARRTCATPAFTDAHVAALEDLEREFTAAARKPAKPGMRRLAMASRLACDTAPGSAGHHATLEEIAFALHDLKGPSIETEALRRAGWVPAATDSTGAELWIPSRAQAAVQALDLLATAPGSSPVLSMN